VSRLEIFPQRISLFPGDRRQFTARATPPQPLWFVYPAMVNSVVQPDYSVRRAQASPLSVPTFFAAASALNLISGLGAIKYTLDKNCLPSSGGSVFAVEATFITPE
jgi:hypothetical protein